MIRLEYFTRADFRQLIGWISSEHLLTNWAGSLFRYPLTEESLEWYIDNTNDPKESDALVYKVVDTETGNSVGHVSLGSISRKNRSGRISRVLVGDSAQKGRGLCTAMISHLLRIGFEDIGLHRISLGVYDFNHAAIRCYEKCGFIREGVQRDIMRYEDHYWSLLEMSILEDEWRARRELT
jgi:RimJ/RimL family protein N-acetyltransferase